MLAVPSGGAGGGEGGGRHRDPEGSECLRWMSTPARGWSSKTRKAGGSCPGSAPPLWAEPPPAALSSLPQGKMNVLCLFKMQTVLLSALNLKSRHLALYNHLTNSPQHKSLAPRAVPLQLGAPATRPPSLGAKQVETWHPLRRPHPALLPTGPRADPSPAQGLL